jgi:hypothetical protein
MASVRRNPLLGILLTVAAISAIVCWGPIVGAEEKAAHLSYALPEGKLFKYETSRLTEHNYQGMTLTRSHSMDVEMTLAGLSEDGCGKVSLTFSNEDASLLRDDELTDYEPQVKLDGKTVYAFVDSKGTVERAEFTSSIPGLGSLDELREMIEDWFVGLPDTEIAIGQGWSIDILKKGAGGAGDEPEVKGRIDFKLKKIEVKGGIEIAEIEGKSYIEINRAERFGRVIAEGKGEIKTKVAVEGGYIIECKRKTDVKGKILGEDPITGKASESETAATEYFECKLKE